MAEIIKTRIIPKKLADAIISRERLITLINNNIHKNVVLISGPAGYGKTTLVLDYFRHSGKKYAWFYLEPDVNNFRSFMTYMVYSLRELNNNFGNGTLELMESIIESNMFVNDEANSISAVIGTFVNEFLSCYIEDVYLVIDDFHNAGDGAWLKIAFNSLIDDIPANLHIFITSRSMPDFNYSKLTAKRNILKIGSAKLNFNIDETEQLLKEIYSIDCSQKDLKLLDARLEGWVTGLHLILQSYGKNFAAAIDKRNVIEENIFALFAEEIFRSLDSPAREFLLITSMVDWFTDEFCNSIPELKNPSAILKELIRKNIYIELSLDDSDGTQKYTYSYHNLFKQFLQEKMPELKSQAEIENIASRIFEYYYSTNDMINAVPFSLQAKKYDKAAELIISSFYKMFNEGRSDQLESWISSIPQDILSKYPMLKYFRGLVLKQYKIDLDAAAKLFSEVNQSEKKGSQLYILAESELAEIMLVKGRPEDSVKSLNELLEVCKKAEQKIKVSISLAKAYYRLGSKYYDNILKILDNTIELCANNNIREFHSELYSLYGKVYQNKGDFSKSLHYFKNVIQLEKNIFRKFQTITDIVLLHSWSGEYGKAKEYMDTAEEIYRKYRSDAFKRGILRTTALFKFETGDFEDSIKMFNELNSIDIKNNIHSYSFLYYLFICESYILLDKREKAKEYLSLAISSKESGEEFRDLLVNYHNAIIENLGTPHRNVEKSLLLALKYFTDNDLIYSKTQAEFHMADYYFKTGNFQTALKYLMDSLNTSSQKKYSSFLVQNFVLKRYLFDLAAANKLQTEYIQSVYDILTERSSFEWLSDECKKRMKKESVLLSDITLNTFGGVEMFVRGIPVKDARWIRKKSKLLLIYLLIHKEQKHTKDKILELFFGELSAESAENLFHQAITNIRNVVRPNYIGAESKDKKKSAKQSQSYSAESFILYEDKILRIAEECNCKIDISEFTQLVNQARNKETTEDERILISRQAIDIYKGQFFPGYYDDWIEDIRINMQNRFINLCEELLATLKKKLRFDEMIYYGERLISEDKLNEKAFIGLIEAYSETGNQNMAKKKFAQLLKNYEEEYGEKPEKVVLDRIGKVLNSE